MFQAKFGMTASWAFALAALLGCGGGGSSGGAPSAAQTKEMCVKVCERLATCANITPDCGYCSSMGTSGPGGVIPPACNTNEVYNAVQQCVDGSCATLQGCLSAATDSCSSTGTGGTTGTGGSTGNTTGGIRNTGGTTSSTGGTGSGDCSVCTKAYDCCLALTAQLGQDVASCASATAAMCMSAGAAQSSVISACQQILQSGVSFNIAACK